MVVKAEVLEKGENPRFVLLQFIRAKLAGTELARAQCNRIRLCLLKVGARVRQSARRIWLQLPSSYPWQDFWPWLVPRLAQ